jgi:SPX domain protein involved in polyphosphate accumulation
MPWPAQPATGLRSTRCRRRRRRAQVQALIGRKRLRPVLHVRSQRLLFQMPFDTSVRLTLDTDVSMTRLADQVFSHALVIRV